MKKLQQINPKWVIQEQEIISELSEKIKSDLSIKKIDMIKDTTRFWEWFWRLDFLLEFGSNFRDKNKFTF